MKIYKFFFYFRHPTLTAAILFLAVYSVFAADELTVENCKCWTGYKASKSSEGTVQCEGIMLLNIRPCNVPEPPECKCTGEVNGILNDGTGTYCSLRMKGQEVKKWKCENEEEWKKYEEEVKKSGLADV